MGGAGGVGVAMCGGRGLLGRLTLSPISWMGGACCMGWTLCAGLAEWMGHSLLLAPVPHPGCFRPVALQDSPPSSCSPAPTLITYPHCPGPTGDM